MCARHHFFFCQGESMSSDPIFGCRDLIVCGGNEAWIVTPIFSYWQFLDWSPWSLWPGSVSHTDIYPLAPQTRECQQHRAPCVQPAGLMAAAMGETIDKSRQRLLSLHLYPLPPTPWFFSLSLHISPSPSLCISPLPSIRSLCVT